MRISVFTLLIFLVVQKGLSQPLDTVKNVDNIFSKWNNSTPGGSILVARGEKVIYHKAFGLANMEANIPNTTETIFEAGSVSKQFTAYSILLLANEGKLKLSDDIRKYLPELPVYEAPITIQHCLNHTSGLKDWGSVGALTGWPRGTRDYTLPLALHIMSKQKSTNFKPGEEYSYSNSNYTALTFIVERVSKQSLEDFTRDRLFKPLGMTHTRWRSNFRDIVPGRAQAYSKHDEHYELEMPFEHVYGHGGLLTTTGDLLKWNQLLEKHDDIYNERVRKGKLNNGKEITYAAGIQHDNIDGVAEIAHSGATAGYRAWLAYYPENKITVVFLSNDANFNIGEAALYVSDIYCNAFLGDDEFHPDPKPEFKYDPKPYVGRYYSEEAECSYNIIQKGNKLVAVDDALHETELKGYALDVFDFDSGKIEFTKTGLNISVSRAKNVPFKKVK